MRRAFEQMHDEDDSVDGVQDDIALGPQGPGATTKRSTFIVSQRPPRSQESVYTGFLRHMCQSHEQTILPWRCLFHPSSIILQNVQALQVAPYPGQELFA